MKSTSTTRTARLRVLHTLVHSSDEVAEIYADLRSILEEARRQRQEQARQGSSPWWFFPSRARVRFLQQLAGRVEDLGLVVEDLHTIVEELRRQRGAHRGQRRSDLEVVRGLFRRSPELVEGGAT